MVKCRMILTMVIGNEKRLFCACVIADLEPGA